MGELPRKKDSNYYKIRFNNFIAHLDILLSSKFQKYLTSIVGESWTNITNTWINKKMDVSNITGCSYKQVSMNYWADIN